MSVFGDRLALILDEKNMTQKELANKLDVTAATVSQWVKGYVHPTADGLAKIAKLLNVSIDYLMGISNEKVPLVVTDSDPRLNDYEFIRGSFFKLSERERKGIIKLIKELLANYD